MASPSKEFIDAVKNEMERQGYKSANRSNAMSKANSLINAYDFLMGGNIGEHEELAQIIDNYFHTSKNKLDEVKSEIKNAQAVINDMKEVDIKLPESKEGRILALHRELIRNFHVAGVSPDVAAKCISYIIWAYLGNRDDAPTLD